MRSSGLTTDISEKVRVRESVQRQLLREQALGALMRSLIAAGDADAVFVALHRCLRRELGLEDLVVLQQRSDGSYRLRWESRVSQGAPAEPEVGLVEALLRSATDLEGKDAPQAARESEFLAARGARSWHATPIDGLGHRWGVAMALGSRGEGAGAGEAGFVRAAAGAVGLTLLRQQAEAQAAQDAKLRALGTLAAGMAHDLNNVIGGIMGAADLLAMDEHGPEVREIGGMVSTLGERASELTRQVLTFGRPEVACVEEVRLRTVLGECVRSLEVMVPKTVRIFADLGCDPIVRADAARLRQVVTNLAINGVQAMEWRGRLEIVLTCVEAAEGGGAGGYAEIRVTDHGPGIPPESLGHIFEPYYTTKPEGEGTGLGLAIVATTVAALRGRVEVDSTLGHGTTFRVLLPLLGASSAVDASPAASTRRRES